MAAVPLRSRDLTPAAPRYDALNRPIELIAPHSDQPGAKVNVIQPSYNEANLLERVRWPTCAAAARSATATFRHQHRLRRQGPAHADRLRQRRPGRPTTYDPLTFRLTHLLTRRNAVAFPDDCPQPPPADWPGCQVQNLHYTYDPAGNITHIRDDAQQTIYFREQARRAERRLHLRRHLPADRGHGPRAPGAGRRRADPTLVQRRATRRHRLRQPTTATPWGRTSSATSTTPSATSWRCSIAAAIRRTPAGRAPTPTTRRA